ncbi:(2Fe-2S) ferredoxin [Mycolicibacterium murale]|uniref:(2Fe-2S) ferredoxin n=1 Tax=Mycolicibacterium murale TaxID=182220 RepID=A0A7I9WLW8_9MYCO|nr:aromatic ring-hydroxylating dioxygenase subunit alpha [Mycolicibacterium murale]MCV7180406.1 aromatic ring-hydroxylating dioxygenase subunit alpha [Mycolicibacterium murale]GFG58725.1 (2Fe-2S) ferredoxin [Mycolicibacterium murale]
MTTTDVPRDNAIDARSLPPVAASDHVTDIVGGIVQSTLDVGEAIGLPPEAYTSDEFFEFERQAIFNRSWLFLCHANELAEQGASFRATILGEPILATRSSDGSIHVMSAVCQHRGHSLCADDVNGRHIRCPYHSWTYNLEGKLVGAPSMTPEWEIRQLRKNIRLPQIRCEVWQGLLFVNFDPDAAPLADSLHRLDGVITHYRMADLVPAATIDLDGLAYNWKNMLENALEEYHTMYVHAGLHDNAPPELVRHGEYESGEAGIYRHAGLVIKGGEDVPGRPTFPLIDGLTEDARADMIFFAVPPSLFIVVYPHGIKSFRIIPRSAGVIDMRVTFFYPPSTLELPGFPKMLEEQMKFVELIDQPDVETNLRVFEGLQSRFAPRGPLGPQERTLPQLYQWFSELCSAAITN